MDFLVEIILLIFVAPLIEVLLTALASFLGNRNKWHPVKDTFDRQIENSTDTVFDMQHTPETRVVTIFSLASAIAVFIINIIVYTVIYVSEGMTLNDYIVLEIVSQALLFPILLSALHYATKKFCFIDNEIIIKSAIYIKCVRFEQITSVAEINHSRLYLALKVTYNKLHNNKCKIKSFKIVQTFGNYERAKKRFSDMQFIK